MRGAGVLIIWLLSLGGVQADYTPEELERWFNDDAFEPPRLADEVEVNDGQLVLLDQVPAGVHHHFNNLTIEQQSLVTGWVGLQQCHENIDQVSRAQILFNKTKIEGLRITSSRNIEKVWIEGASVQMENIAANARLCVTARSHALRSNPDGSYTLRNGPFMRRFLDGYYPMRVSMEIDTGQSGLILERMVPDPLEGLKLQQQGNKIMIEAMFEGRLRTELRFQKAGSVTSRDWADHRRP